MSLSDLEENKKNGIVYMPLGTIEWHEKHLPIGMDGLTALEICKLACQKTGGIVIPPLYFGTDKVEEIDGKKYFGMERRLKKKLPGEFYYLDKELFYKVILSVIDNIKEQGFKKLVIVSGHAGSAQIEILERIDKIYGELKVFVFDWKPFSDGSGHAGSGETSLGLFLFPELVNLDKLLKPYNGPLKTSPHEASVEKGKQRIEKIVSNVVESVKRL